MQHNENLTVKSWDSLHWTQNKLSNKNERKNTSDDKNTWFKELVSHISLLIFISHLAQAIELKSLDSNKTELTIKWNNWTNLKQEEDGKKYVKRPWTWTSLIRKHQGAYSGWSNRRH